MSISVDKMESKSIETLNKTKSAMKRRKTSSFSDLSTGSESPTKKHIYHDLSEDYRSSPEMGSPISSSYGNLWPMAAISGQQPLSDIERRELLHPSVSTWVNRSTSQAPRTTRAPSIDADHSTHHSHNAHHHNHTPDDSHPSDNLCCGEADGHSNGRGRYRDSGCGTTNGVDSDSSVNSGQRPRTTEDFYLFCQFILEYENYNGTYDQENLRDANHSPLDSTGSAAESTLSSAANDESNHASSAVDSGADIDAKEDEELDEASEALKEDPSKSIDASSTNGEEDESADIDADSYNLVTCYCGKPYANRPMIECSQCLTWLHLSCAKIKRRHIPDIFICVKCVKQNDQNAKETTKNTDHNEPNENSQTNGSSPQARSDKMENNILQPLNGSFETGANKLENLKTSTGVAVKYK